jgi:hypothetical protein
MADEQPNKYAVMLAQLQAERVKLDAAIEAMRPLAGLEIGSDTISPSSESTITATPDHLPAKVDFDTFFSLSIPEAIKKYLAMMKRPQTVADITKALETGGLSTTATNLMGTVTATLTRMKRINGDVVAVRRGEWALTEWYKGRRFDKPEPTKKPKKRGAKSKKAKPSSENKKAPEKAPGRSKKVEPEKKHEPPTSEQIERVKVLHASGKGFGEIAKEVGLHQLAVYRIIGKKAKPTPSTAAQA